VIEFYSNMLPFTALEVCLVASIVSLIIIIIIIIIIIKEIYIAPFRHAPKGLCKQKVKC